MHIAPSLLRVAVVVTAKQPAMKILSTSTRWLLLALLLNIVDTLRVASSCSQAASSDEEKNLLQYY
jgi:hypothetical protein